LLDSRADRIRAWLKDNYVEEDIGFALLIGNPDPGGQMQHNVPMKPCATSGETSVTDFYYADLSGHWDQSGNGVVCDFGYDDLDLSGEGAIDFVPEVYVGRIPCYSDGAAAVDEILARIMAYEQDSVDGDIHWRRRMMLPDSIYFFENQYGDTGYRRWDGATVGEWFIRDQLVPRGIEWTTLYEQEGVSPSNFESHLPLDTYNVVDQWNRGYGLVFWTGHGSNTGVYRLIWTNDDNQNEIPDWNPSELDTPSFMEASDLHMLQEAPPPFVIHGSCSNGYPEDSTNLGYSLLRRGAIGTVSASRAAMTWHWPMETPEIWEKPEVWDGDVIDIVSEYAVNLLDGMEAGRALGEAIALTTDGQGSNSWYQKSIQNLYGDPLVRLVLCREDSECDNGVFCDGDELCDSGSCVPATSAACGPTADCADVTCDEEADLCVQDPACENEPDAGEDAGQPESLVTGAGSGCRQGPAPARGLLAILGRLGLRPAP
ncbi:MAG TPA: C25 family cysteine peptidase, partial [Polyangia bacterium]|nr:C25 family cysteine peptidase [Polyangia bacterium]